MPTIAYTGQTHSPEATRRLGEAVARLCTGGEVFLLDGDLGAGKTCVTQGIARGLDVSGDVTSPTFVLHCQYLGRLELNHIDAYRLEGAENLAGLGFDELFGAPDNVTVVEWPQMLGDAFPRGCIHVLIRTGDSASSREMTFEAKQEPGYAFINKLRAALPVNWE